MTIQKVGVIGGGAWGTALAQTLCLAGKKVCLWAREDETVEDINKRHVNRTFLSGIPLDKNLIATRNISEVVTSHEVLLMVTPAQHLRAIAKEISSFVRSHHVLVLCSKGFEKRSGKLLGDVLNEILPQQLHAVLSGPSFAVDVARGLPTALTIGCPQEDIGKHLAEGLGYRQFRLYWSSDRKGVEIGGALKNVLAIAAGIMAAKGLGASAHAALVTRGFAEMCRLTKVLGGRRETITGLSGLGDLILTCGSPQSRNMSLGYALGQGKTLQEILNNRVTVSEGVETVFAVTRIAQEKGIEMPISKAVEDILTERKSVDMAISELLQRPFRAEDE